MSYTFDTWTGQAVTLTLAAVDDEGGTGVQATYYTLNGGEPQTYLPDGIVLDTEGEHLVTFWSVDSAGNLEAAQQVTVRIDLTAPVCTCTVTPNQLFPVNHKLVTVVATVSMSDDASGTTGFTLVSVTSNEPDNDLGDGNTASDIQEFEINTADTTGKLRAERSGKETSRIYTLTYESVDQAGNTGICTGIVTVPHNR
ncbi:hypothetical protein BH24CHL1_BH24CHL1_04450 [soil metagenome]